MEYDRSVAVEQHPVLSMPVHGSCERKALGVAETGSSQCGSIYLCYRIGNVSTISKPYQGVTVGSDVRRNPLGRGAFLGAWN